MIKTTEISRQIFAFGIQRLIHKSKKLTISHKYVIKITRKTMQTIK